MSEPFFALFTHSEVFLSLLEGLVLRPLPFDFVEVAVGVIRKPLSLYQ